MLDGQIHVTRITQKKAASLGERFGFYNTFDYIFHFLIGFRGIRVEGSTYSLMKLNATLWIKM